MPELPEVQTVVDTLSPRLVGRRIAAVRTGPHDVVRPAGVNLGDLLAGCTVKGVVRRGKRIIVETDGGVFFVHLGMTGRLVLAHVGDPVPKHTHVVLELEGENDGSAGVEVRFTDPRRFGGVVWLGEVTKVVSGGDAANGRRESGGRFSGEMGPEPLTMRPENLAKRLATTRRAVKNALLDQGIVAGLGNIYVDESLHAAGIHPLTPASDLGDDQVRRLNRAIKATLRRALRHRGSTLRDYVDADGTAGGFQKLHRVYGREGKPCRGCRRPVVRIVVSGRSTHFCPACQPDAPPYVPRSPRT